VPSQESGPVESLTVRNRLNVFHLTLSIRATLPSYILHGYKGRGASYAHGEISTEVADVELPGLLPGKAAEVELSFSRLDVPHRVRFEGMRLLGFVRTPWSGSHEDDHAPGQRTTDETVPGDGSPCDSVRH
jgi:hypothetical protein